MNISIGEIVFIIINFSLIIGIPIVVAWAGIVLFRRIHALESRIEKLESKQDTSTELEP